MKFTNELALFLKARYPIIYINTIEEDRVEYIIRKNIKTNLNRSIYSWDFVDGYSNIQIIKDLLNEIQFKH